MGFYSDNFRIILNFLFRLWMDDKPHGEGRMIYANGDVYEGFWFTGKRSGYGVLTKFLFVLQSKFLNIIIKGETEIILKVIGSMTNEFFIEN